MTMFIAVSILCVGMGYAVNGMIEHETEIRESFNPFFVKNKVTAIQECGNAFFPSSKNICLSTYALKLHDVTICDGVTSVPLKKSCVTDVRCSNFDPFYKTWARGNNCPNE
ncbi:MAG: hypothetical protein Q7S01_05300 [bacterium]|nr:hypothetical protein [bacterium]